MKNSFFSKKLCYFRTFFSEIKSNQNSKFGQYSNLRSFSSKLSFSEIKSKEIVKFGQYSQPIFSLQIRNWKFRLEKLRRTWNASVFPSMSQTSPSWKMVTRILTRIKNGVRTTKKSNFRLELRSRWNGSVFPRLELRWTWNGGSKHLQCPFWVQGRFTRSEARRF